MKNEGFLLNYFDQSFYGGKIDIEKGRVGELPKRDKKCEKGIKKRFSYQMLTKSNQ